MTIAGWDRSRHATPVAGSSLKALPLDSYDGKPFNQIDPTAVSLSLTPTTRKRVGRKGGDFERPFDLPSQHLEFEPVGKHDVGLNVRGRGASEDWPGRCKSAHRARAAAEPSLEHGGDDLVQGTSAGTPAQLFGAIVGL
jgi:hypothetical protein